MIDEDQHEIRELAERARAEADAHPARRLRLRPPRRAPAGRRSCRAAPRAAGSGWRRRSRPIDRAVQARRAALGLSDHRRPRAAVRRRVARRGQGRRGAARDRDRPARVLPRRSRRAVAASRSSISSRRATTPAPGAMYRIEGGNDRLATALAAPLGDRLHLNTDVVALSHRGQTVRVSVKNGRALSQITCDYAILALPATLLRRMPITPALPAQQHDAIVAPEVRARDEDAAAVLEAVLARAGPAARVRIAAAVRRGLGRQRRAARPRRHPQRCSPAAAPATRRRRSSPSTARAGWPTRSTGSARETPS